jgi:hypothetical protein
VRKEGDKKDIDCQPLIFSQKAPGRTGKIAAYGRLKPVLA